MAGESVHERRRAGEVLPRQGDRRPRGSFPTPTAGEKERGCTEREILAGTGETER